MLPLREPIQGVTASLPSHLTSTAAPPPPRLWRAGKPSFLENTDTTGQRFKPFMLTFATQDEVDRSVDRRELLVNVAFAIAVLSLVLVVGNIFRKLLPFLVNHDVPMEYLVTFIAYILPFSLIFTIPWGLLTAILLVFGRLSADNELIALRANGVSVTRVCVPLAGSRLVARRLVSGSMCRLRRPPRKNCAARFLISPRGIRWRCLAPIRSSISFRAEDLCRQKQGDRTNSTTFSFSRWATISCR